MKIYFKQLCIVLVFSIGNYCSYAQDLSGMWEGKQNLNGKQYNVTFYLAKTNSGYSGVAIYKESMFKINTSGLGNLSSTNIKVDAGNLLGQKATASVQIIGNFINNTFSFTDLGFIESSIKNVNMVSHSDLVYIQNKGKEKLAGQISNQKLELTKKNGDYPDDYAKYKQDPITFSPVSYASESHGNKIKYNDKGVLSFTVANSSDYDIQGINISLHVKEKNADLIGLDGNSGRFSLAKTKSISPEIDIASGFNIPSDSIHFNVTGTYCGVIIFDKQFALATIPFFITDQTTITESSKKIFTVLQGYYGFNGAPCSSVVASLNQFVLSGNKMAPMWKAALLTRGKGGYGIDEDEARPLANKSYTDVLNAARNGNAEAEYLMAYAVGLGLTSDASRDIAGSFLKRSAEAGYLPAMYDYALYLAKDSAYTDSYHYLVDCYNNGMQLAAVEIGNFYREGSGVNKDMQQAIDWYRKGEKFGDPVAMIKLARLYLVGDDGMSPDANKAVGYANRAIDLKSTAAMDFLAKIYLNGRSGIPKNTLKAIALYKEAASLGDSEAMAALAYLYLPGNDNSNVPADEKLAIFWAKKSAEAGGAMCMPLMAHLYATGKINGQKDIIRARFWENQARLNGVGGNDNTAKDASSADFANIIGGIDFSDHYSYYKDTETGDIYQSNDGPDIFGSLFTSILSANATRRANQQEVINGVEYMYTFHGKKIYGGTLTSTINTNISLFEGEHVKIEGYGAVNLGMMAGVGGPDGIAGFQSYCVDPQIPHGAIMIGINKKWTFAGSKKVYKAPADGILQLAINDADYTNNQGYFDVVITTD